MPTMSVDTAINPPPVDPGVSLRPAVASGSGEQTFGAHLQRAGAPDTERRPQQAASGKNSNQDQPADAGAPGLSAEETRSLATPTTDSATVESEVTLATTECAVDCEVVPGDDDESATVESVDTGIEACLDAGIATILAAAPVVVEKIEKCSDGDEVDLPAASDKALLDVADAKPNKPSAGVSSPVTSRETAPHDTTKPVLHTRPDESANPSAPDHKSKSIEAAINPHEQPAGPQLATPGDESSDGKESTEVAIAEKPEPVSTSSGDLPPIDKTSEISSPEGIRNSDQRTKTRGDTPRSHPVSGAAAEATDVPTNPRAKRSSIESGARHANRDSAPTADVSESNAKPAPSSAPSTIAPAVTAIAVDAAAPAPSAANSRRSERTSDSRTSSAASTAPKGETAQQPVSAPQTGVGSREPISVTAISTPLRMGSSKAAAGGDSLSEVDRVRFVQRVARAMHTAADRGGELRLRLSPPELGSLKLEVTVHEGVLSARLETETPVARQVLMDNLPALRERLAEQNIKIDRFDVDVRDGSSGSSSDQTAGQANPDSQRNMTGRGRMRRTDESPTMAMPVTSPRMSADGKLNVIV